MVSPVFVDLLLIDLIVSSHFFLLVKGIKINTNFVYITWFIILWDFHKLVSHMWQDTVMARRTNL